MAKKKKKVNISKLIRDILDENPDAKPAEIIEELEQHPDVDPGSVTPQYVSTIKSNTKRRIIVSDDPTVRRLHLAKEFCGRLGGASEAHKAINDFQALCSGATS